LYNLTGLPLKNFYKIKYFTKNNVKECYTETFSGEFKYTVFRYGNNGISDWFNEDIGFVSKSTVYINRPRSWYDNRQKAYDAAIKWLKKQQIRK